VDFAGGGFDADDLWRKLVAINPVDTVVTYGSGLENQPQLLDKISRHFSVLGNTPGVVAQVKDPRRFFPLLDELGIAHPETSVDALLNDGGWLVKGIGGSGGMHIRLWDGGPGGYYQRRTEGLPASVLFLADGANIQIIGYNEQWPAPAPGLPYRYGGAAGNADFPEDIKSSMAEAARRVSAAVGLCGLNSMDFLLAAGGPLALEVNPRLSASFDLYGIPDLFERHLQACRGALMPLPGQTAGSRAHLIHYANHDVELDETVQWPEWTADVPPAGTVCIAGEPVCSVLAQACDANAAKQLVFARAQLLDAQLQPFTRNSGKQ
jgi:uncharacterized protein